LHTAAWARGPHGIHLRNFGIDPSGRLLVTSSIRPLPVRDGNEIKPLTPGPTVYRVGGDGKLAFARKYDVDGDVGAAGKRRQTAWWPRPESNRHSGFPEADFKSAVSTFPPRGHAHVF
jgi:hypothetical protein